MFSRHSVAEPRAALIAPVTPAAASVPPTGSTYPAAAEAGSGATPSTHWTTDRAAYRRAHVAPLRNPNVWLAVLAFLSIAWPAFWLLAVMSRAVALGPGV